MYTKALAGLFFILGLTLTTFGQDIKSHGVTFPAKMKINDEVVKYNGSGLREKYFIDLYVSALYLKSQSTDAKKIINADEEMCIRLKIVSNKVTRDKFVETVKEGFKTSTTGKATDSEIDAFMKLFSKSFKSGDDIILIYKPGTGVQVVMNGENLGTQKGLEFKKALWGIWFGDKPVDAGLKNAMLGKV
jgi:hypothetical protein